jgi:hypothetical protein
MPTAAGTIAFFTFVFFQAFNLLNVRDDTRSVFSRETLENTAAFVATGAVDVLLVLVVEMDILHGFFTTTDLTSGQWLVCAAIGSAILWTGEVLKIVLRARARRGGPAESPEVIVDLARPTEAPTANPTGRSPPRRRPDREPARDDPSRAPRWSPDAHESWPPAARGSTRPVITAATTTVQVFSSPNRNDRLESLR